MGVGPLASQRESYHIVHVGWRKVILSCHMARGCANMKVRSQINARNNKRAHNWGFLLTIHVGADAASHDASAATLRTYRPSSKSMKDYNPPPAQHNPSPNLAAAGPSSYAVLKASMRRSISPRAAAHALPLNKRPAWDASPPPRRSPQRAQHGLPESNLNAEPIAQPLPQRSGAGAQRAQHGMEEIGGLKVSSQRPKPLSSAESAALAVAALLDAGQSASPNRRMTPFIRQTQPSPRVRQQPMQSPATSQPHPSAGTIDEFSALPSDLASSVAELVGDDASGGNNPTKLSRNPSSSNPSSSQPATGLLQPAWVSPTQRRRTSASQQPSPLRRTTGSRTLSPPKATADRPAATADRPAVTADRSAATAHHRTTTPPRAAHAAPPGTTQGLTARQGLGHAQAYNAAEQTDAAQLDARGRSPSLAANLQADAHSLAHAQALQRLQQAVQEYKSSSANVLVPAAVQLAAALRRASRATEEPVQSVEALRLAGLKLRHEAGVDGADEHVPKSPWPDWVRGAWGSPHGPRGEADKVSSHGNKRGGLESAQQAQRAKAAAPVQSDNTRARDKQQNQFELAQQAEQAGSNQQASPQNRNSSLNPHAEQHSTAANWSPVKTPGPQATRRSTLVQRALSEAAAAAAAAREAPKPRARTTATPPRRAVTKQQRALPPQVPHKRPGQGQPDQALHAVPIKSGKQAGGRAASKTQDTNRKAASKGLKVTGKSKVKAGQQSAEAVQSTAPVQVQTPAVAAAVHAVLDPAAAVESEAAVQTASQVTASDAHTSSHAVSASDEHTETQTEEASMPAHSSTSVAALRRTFEQKAGRVDSIKPQNRLPLRKVSSKAHVLPGDNASPQQRALAWQQSLRDEHDPEDSQHPQAHDLHAAGSQTDPTPAEQPKHSMHEEVTTPTSNATVLMHTMSALVARQGDVSTAAASRYAEADQSDWHSTAQQAAQFNLTEAAVAAANTARSSAKKLPISHRLTVTRSTFDSDQGEPFFSDT